MANQNYATSAARPSRATWFSLGAVFGIGVSMIVALSTMVVMLTARPQSQAAGLPAPTPAKADHAQVARLCALMAAPLVSGDYQRGEPSSGNVLGHLAVQIDQADLVAAENIELAPIAREYADALRSARSIVERAPSAQPLVRAGLDTWRGSVDNNDREFMHGLLSIGTELSKLSEISDQMRAVHARVVACRLRLASVASRTAKPEAPKGTNTSWGEFKESGLFRSVASDTLFLKNISGMELSQVVVVTELVGRDGETFRNCYYADKWSPDQLLLAVCRSESVSRETVRGVRLVRYRIITAERTGRLGSIEVKDNS